MFVRHELKILPEFFEVVTSRRKQFEIRKNDRLFQVSDLVIFRERFVRKFFQLVKKEGE